MKMIKKHVFHQQKEEISQIIEADDDKKLVLDKKGYFLIRLNPAEKRIEVAHVNNKHVVMKIVFGKNAQELYRTIIKEGLVSKLDHAAYLGKELFKAELALKNNKKYVQDSNLKW